MNFLNENVLNSLNISLKFISKGPINNIPALVQIIAKPLSAPIMIILVTHMYVTRHQLFNCFWRLTSHTSKIDYATYFKWCGTCSFPWLRLIFRKYGRDMDKSVSCYRVTGLVVWDFQAFLIYNIFLATEALVMITQQYRKISNIRRNKSPNLNVSRLVL